MVSTGVRIIQSNHPQFYFHPNIKKSPGIFKISQPYPQKLVTLLDKFLMLFAACQPLMTARVITKNSRLLVLNLSFTVTHSSVYVRRI